MTRKIHAEIPGEYQKEFGLLVAERDFVTEIADKNRHAADWLDTSKIDVSPFLKSKADPSVELMQGFSQALLLKKITGNGEESQNDNQWEVIGSLAFHLYENKATYAFYLHSASYQLISAMAANIPLDAHETGALDETDKPKAVEMMINSEIKLPINLKLIQ